MRSVPIGCAEGEVVAIGAGVVDAAGDRGQGEDFGAQSGNAGAVFGDALDPVGIEERGGRSTGNEADMERQAVIGQPAFEPAIGAQQAGAPEVELLRIGVLRIGDIGVHHELRGAHHVIVEHSVHHPGEGGLCRIGGDERGRAGVVHGEMVDDRGRLDHGGVAIRQHREFSCGVGLAHEIHIGRAIGRARIDIAKFEFGAVGVERDQRFPCVGAIP